VETFLLNDCDFVTNCGVASFPQGICVQVFRLKDLERIECESNDPAVREHVSLLFYDHPEIYKTINLIAPGCWHLPNDCRTQLDYPEDLEFIREVCKRLLPVHGYSFSINDLVMLLNAEPSLIDINRHCQEKLTR
jgi:spore coat polysaccharide biosynthesis protein SpsF